MSTTAERSKSCEERIDAMLADTLNDLRAIFEDCPECGSSPGEIGEGGGKDGQCGVCLDLIENRHRPDADGNGGLHEYGLGFDYVAPETFGEDQREGYWRFQMSWGGPSDELRFYSSGPRYSPYRIEYRFMDWFDGASRELTGEAYTLAEYVWSDFEGLGITESAYLEAVEG